MFLAIFWQKFVKISKFGHFNLLNIVILVSLQFYVQFTKFK